MNTIQSFSRALCSRFVCLATLLIPILPTAGAGVPATFTSATTTPITAASYTAAGNTVELSLSFAPPPGTILTVVRNTGTSPIIGRFDNLAQGQTVHLAYNQMVYPFMANYHGGTGNDLVLQWASTRLMTWGLNNGGQLGNGSTVGSLVPIPVDASGVLAGRNPVAVACGFSHNLVLCADGALVTWGTNFNGELGNGTTAASAVPVLVNQAGVLSNKRVVAIATGSSQRNLVLCEDSTLAHWGPGSFSPYVIEERVPALVDATGVLAGREVVSIASDGVGSLVLCGDGTLAQWTWRGANLDFTPLQGQVDQTGVLAGKTVSVIGMGDGHFMAACTDGTLAVWGSNSFGQLGNNSTTYSSVPTLPVSSGALRGKFFASLDGGLNFSMSLSTTGLLTGWGNSFDGQVGDGSSGSRFAPVAVNQAGVLAGKTVLTLACGYRHSLVVCSDGSMAAWGENLRGQLGNNSTTDGRVPVLVNTVGLTTGERFMLAAGGENHSLAIVATPPPPFATTQAAIGLSDSRATLNGKVFANGNTTGVSFEYGLTPSYGTTLQAIPATISGTTASAVSASLDGLINGETYHCRVVATSPRGTSYGKDMTFTASKPPIFSGYAVTTPWQTSAKIPLRKVLARASDPDGGLVTATSAGPTSANGGNAVLQASVVQYTPPSGFSGTDTFPVIISDVGGLGVLGTVTVTVGPAIEPISGGVGGNPPKLTTLPNGDIGIAFQGIPGRSYVLQRSTGGLGNWLTIATMTANASGLVSFTDESPPPGNAFYRLGMP